MKKFLLIAAVASMAAPAFASKARLNALGNAQHLVDSQTVFDNPSHLSRMSDYVTFETGSTNLATGATASTSAIAEGGFVRSAGDGKYMAYVGRKSDFTAAYRPVFGFLNQDNPIEMDYSMKGAINWGAGFNYSSSDKKSTSQKQNAYGIRLGASTDVWEAFADIGLGSKATGATLVPATASIPVARTADINAEYKGTAGFKLGGAYKMENLYSYFTYYQDGFEYTSAANSTTWDGMKIAQSQADIGVVDHNKIDGGQWFYGAAYRAFQSKRDGTAMAALTSKTTTSSLPFLLGIEYDATSWATLRASATQNVLLGSSKTDAGTVAAGTVNDEADTIANNTTVAAGMGLKFNKWTIDGSWAASTTGDVNTTSFLTNVALTYSF